MLLIGIDLGTSAVKMLLVNEKGDILSPAGANRTPPTGRPP